MGLNLKIGFKIIIVPLIAYLIFAMLRLSMGVIIPEVIEEYGLSEVGGGGLLTSFSGAMSIFIIFGGYISDRIGKKITMSMGLTIMSFGIILAGHSAGYLSLLTFLFITGIGSGIFLPTLYALVGEVVPAARGALIGVTNGFFGLGGFLGPWVTAMLILNIGWRSPFWLIGGLSLAFSVLLWLNPYLKDHQERATVSSEGGYLPLLRDHHIIFLCIGIGIANFAYTSFIAWTPSYMEKIGNLNLSEVGLAFGSYSIIGALGAIFFGALSDRVGRRRTIFASGFPTFILSLLFFSGQIGQISLMVLSGVLGFTSFAYWNLAISAMQDHVDNRFIGAATGLMICVGLVSATFAPTVSGFMITNYGFNSALILSAALPQLLYVIVTSKATN